ncbi:MAG: SGNH/GDSL hydrolase family protein [Pseudomonadota bacterium]
MIGDGKLPDVLALGDSWFWYPFNNLLIPIWNLWAGGRTILAQGMVGAEATELASGQWLKDFRAALRGWSTIRAVLISAGGNDFAGMDDMQRILRPDCSGATAGEDCFDAAATDQLMLRDVAGAYGVLLDEIERWRPEAMVFLHNYDYAVPSGKGIFGFGHWLKQPMDAVGVPAAVQPLAVEHLINTFSDALAQVQKDYAARTLIVDSSGTLAEADWANELHPTPAGFNKLVNQAWQPVLLNNLP